MGISGISILMLICVCGLILTSEHRKVRFFHVAKRATFFECAAHRKLTEWRDANPNIPLFASTDGRQLVYDCMAAWTVFLLAHPEYKDDGRRLAYLRSLLEPDDPYHPPPGKRRLSPYVPKRLADASRSFLLECRLPSEHSSGIIIPIYAFRK